MQVIHSYDICYTSAFIYLLSDSFSPNERGMKGVLNRKGNNKPASKD